MGREPSNGKMEGSMLEDGKKGNSMEKVRITLDLEKCEREFGIMEQELGLISKVQ